MEQTTLRTMLGDDESNGEQIGVISDALKA